MMMVNSIKQSTQQRRREGTKRKDPKRKDSSLGQKSETKVGHKGGKGTNYVPKPPPITRSIYIKRQG
jgi:hypothetical protein